jgi:hypothetical protein
MRRSAGRLDGAAGPTRSGGRTLARTAGVLAAGGALVASAVLGAGPASGAAHRIELGASSAALASAAVADGSGALSVVNGFLQPATGTPVPPSGQQAALLGSASVVSTTVTGSGRVVLGGIGEYCQGWPTVRVRVDGQVMGDTTLVSATSYGSYPVGPALAAGSHAVELTLVNDRFDAECDRNALIGSVRLETAGGAPAQPITPPAQPNTQPAAPGVGGTGVPAGTQLTRHEGNLTVTTDGAVIDGLDITGVVKVNADDVTIRRSIIRGGAAGPGNSAMVVAWGPQRGLTIEDTTLVPDHPSYWLDGVVGHDFTLRRVDISGVIDSVKVINGGNVLLADSWLHGNSHFDPDPIASGGASHDDSVQIQGGSNITLQGNTIEGAFNAGVMITQDQSRASDIRIVGNRLAGGGCTVNVSEKGKGPITGLVVQDNTFGSSRIADCGIIAPPSSPVSPSGNVWADGGAVRVRAGS